MATFTDNWDSDRSSDDTNATEIDDYMNKLATDIEERLKQWVYGYVAGENDGIGGLIYAKFKEQTSTPTTPASVFGLVAKDDTGTSLYALPEGGGTAVKILNASGQFPAGAYAADSIDEDDIRLANNANLTARNAANDGDVNLIKANASDKVVIPDGAQLATSAAPTADAQISNKKYVDDTIASLLSAVTNEDSEASAMVKAHAYLAATDGFVHAYVTTTGTNNYLRGYVDDTDDPAGAGEKLQDQVVRDTGGEASIFITVAAGEYFEITTDSTNEPTIYWRSIGTLSNPVDQD